ATEAGAVGVFVIVVYAILMKRGVDGIRHLSGSIISTLSSVGAVFLLIVGASTLTSLISITGVGQMVSTGVEHLELGRVGLLLAIMLVYLVLGMFLDPLAMLLLTIPVLVPSLNLLEVDLLWFGVFAVLMAEISILTPPV